MTLADELWCGERSIRLTGLWGAVVVLPGRGAKIASIVQNDGHEWLAQPRGTLTPLSDDLEFIDADVFGWDEIAPTLTTPGYKDHGEVWQRPWTSRFQSNERSEWEVVGDESRYILRRSIRLTTTGFELSYKARALRERIPFLWMAHPQFRAPVGTLLTMSPSLATVVRPDTVIAPSSEADPWPLLGEVVRGVPKGAGRKAWAPRGGAPESITLSHPSGDRLTLSWPKGIRDCALWIDNEWASREPVICPEPATSHGDDLREAVTAGDALWLDVDRWTSWSIVVMIEHSSSQRKSSAR